MAEPLPKRMLDSVVHPAEIAQQSFDLERRGFDQRQVHAYLRAVADALSDAQQREAEMRTRLGKAISRAEAAEKTARSAPAHDPSEITRQIGDEVTAVLDAARAAGEQRIVAAEKSAERLMASAKAEATELRGAAETIMGERRAAADAAAKEIIAKAQSASDALVAQARLDADAIRNKAADRVAMVRDECDALIREAEEARAQILEDMERRRRLARAQVERLRVGRDRLLRSYEIVRRTLEEATFELKTSLAEAKVRGDTAARLIASEPLASREELEAELTAAKVIASPRRPTEAKALSSPALPRRLDPPKVPNIDLRTESAPIPRKPLVAEAKLPGAVPRPPAVAPTLKITPEVAATPPGPSPEPTDDEGIESDDQLGAHAGDLDSIVADDPIDRPDPIDALAAEPLDEELARLEDPHLDIVTLSDDIEEVVALVVSPADVAGESLTDEPDDAHPASAPTLVAKRRRSAPTRALFSALRDQSVTDESETAEVPATPMADSAASSEDDAAIVARRSAVIADSADHLERRLKRALADEQNDLLAGLRATKKNETVDLTSFVGDVDSQLRRYVAAINDAAVVAYGAGAALVDATRRDGELPAGAVEELLVADVIAPIRERLEALAALEADSADLYVDPVRAFYRQRKTDHLSTTATRLAQLLCTAGLCDALPAERFAALSMVFTVSDSERP